MKRILLATFLCTATLLYSHAIAQTTTTTPDPAAPKKDSIGPKIEFGLKLGLNMQELSGNVWDNGFKPGVVAGITLGMHKKKIGVRAEVLVGLTSFSSSVIRDSLDNGQFRATYLHIPILFEYSFIPALKVQIGPQYSNQISVKTVKGFQGDPKVLFKQSELSGVIGLEVKLPANLSAGARYIMGFTDVNNNTSSTADEWKTQAIQIYARYTIQ